MLSKTFGVLFHLRKRNDPPESPHCIFLRITVDGVSREVSMQHRCRPDQWNKVTGRMIGNKEPAQAVNAYLDTIQAKVYEARHRLIEAFQHHNEQMAALVGKEYAAGTLTNFKTALKHRAQERL